MYLSEKHGVAPALTFCRICGNDTNELALLGAKADSVMKKLHKATDGEYGSASGYEEYGHNKIPSDEPCDDCKEYLLKGGMIIIARDTEEYLRLDKEHVDLLVGRVANKDGMCIDFNKMRGRVHTMDKAFWRVADGNIVMRDPEEWS